MNWDIYGEPLRRGHCEVHPHVHEEYPCSVCIADKQANDQQGMCKGGCESEHLLGLAREHIKELEAGSDAMEERVNRLQAFRSAVCGWRENDWPEWFCRRTAEAVADRGRQAEEITDGR